MTPIGTETTQLPAAQTRLNAAPNMRTRGDSRAGSFQDLFAEKVAVDLAEPAPDELAQAGNGSADQASDAESDADASDADGSDAAGSDAGEAETQGAKANGSAATAAQAAGAAAGNSKGTSGQPGAENAGGKEDRADGPGVVDGGVVDFEAARDQPAAAMAAHAAPVTGQEQVRHELKNAAVVDLTELARSELLGPARGGDDQPARTAQGDREVPDRDPAPKQPNAASAGTTTPGGKLVESDGGKPPPGFQAPVFRPDAGATHASGTSHTPGKSPSDPDHPITASNPARSADPGLKGQGDASLRADAAAARAAFLDRLANNGAARRGAVSAVERVVVGDRAGIGTEAKAAPQRAIAFKPVDAPPPTRDAFLAPVQRGLGKMLAEGGGKLTVMLRPQELGDVRIAMETGRGSVRVKMEASSDAARKVLESGMDSLRTTLEARGVRVETMEVVTADRQDPAFAGGRDNAADGQGQQGQGRHGDGRGGSGSHSREQESPERTDDIGLTPEQSRRLWTELGIDAVA